MRDRGHGRQVMKRTALAFALFALLSCAHERIERIAAASKSAGIRHNLSTTAACSSRHAEISNTEPGGAPRTGQLTQGITTRKGAVKAQASRKPSVPNGLPDRAKQSEVMPIDNGRNIRSAKTFSAPAPEVTVRALGGLHDHNQQSNAWLVPAETEGVGSRIPVSLAQPYESEVRLLDGAPTPRSEQLALDYITRHHASIGCCRDPQSTVPCMCQVVREEQWKAAVSVPATMKASGRTVFAAAISALGAASSDSVTEQSNQLARRRPSSSPSNQTPTDLSGLPLYGANETDDLVIPITFHRAYPGPVVMMAPVTACVSWPNAADHEATCSTVNWGSPDTEEWELDVVWPRRNVNGQPYSRYGVAAPCTISIYDERFSPHVLEWAEFEPYCGGATGAVQVTPGDPAEQQKAIKTFRSNE